MNPRRFLNFFRSPTGALVLFLIGLVIVLLLVNSRRQSHDRVSLVPKKLIELAGKPKAQLPETVRRDMVPFDPSGAKKEEPTPAPLPAKPESTPQLPALSLVAETPVDARQGGEEIQRRFCALRSPHPMRAGHHG